MRVNRLELLQALDAVKPGVAVKEQEAQSSCIVFTKGYAVTYSGEVLCRHKCDIGVEGAVFAKPLLEILNKMPEDDLEITQSKKGEELRIKGKGRSSGIRMQTEIVLNYDSVEKPARWVELHEDFNEAIELAQDCASKEVSANAITCVHIHPEFVEACDNYQIFRLPFETGIKQAILVKRDSIRHIVGADMAKMAVTQTWVHFRNATGLYLACRCYLDKYPSFAKYYKKKFTNKVTLPGGLDEACAGAEVFSAENAEMNEVRVKLGPNILEVRGEGSLGWYAERKKIKYSGPELEFLVSPKLLSEISNKHNEGYINGEFLKIDTGRYTYMTCLAPTKESKDAEDD